MNDEEYAFILFLLYNVNEYLFVFIHVKQWPYYEMKIELQVNLLKRILVLTEIKFSILQIEIFCFYTPDLTNNNLYHLWRQMFLPPRQARGVKSQVRWCSLLNTDRSTSCAAPVPLVRHWRRVHIGTLGLGRELWRFSDTCHRYRTLAIDLEQLVWKGARMSIDLTASEPWLDFSLLVSVNIHCLCNHVPCEGGRSDLDSCTMGNWHQQVVYMSWRWCCILLWARWGLCRQSAAALLNTNIHTFFINMLTVICLFFCNSFILTLSL